MEKGSEQPKKHTLLQTARQKAVISGVLRVNSFDEQLVSLATDCGEMTVEGEAYSSTTSTFTKCFTLFNIPLMIAESL